MFEKKEAFNSARELLPFSFSRKGKGRLRVERIRREFSWHNAMGSMMNREYGGALISVLIENQSTCFIEYETTLRVFPPHRSIYWMNSSRSSGCPRILGRACSQLLVVDLHELFGLLDSKFSSAVAWLAHLCVLWWIFLNENDLGIIHKVTRFLSKKEKIL